jgi:NTE family protein
MGESDGRKQALVLSGGSFKGAFQAGAIAEILKPQYNFRPTAVYGISVGSINGGMLASYFGRQFQSGKTPDLAAAGKELEDYWCSKVLDFTQLGHRRNPFVLLWEIFFGTFKGMVNVDRAIKIMRDEIRPPNLLVAADKGKLEFYSGTLDLTEGEYYDKPWNDPLIVEYVISSAMMPIVMPTWSIQVSAPKASWRDKLAAQVKEIQLSIRDWQHRHDPTYPDRYDSWLDGGVHNVAPLGKPIADGYNDIVCIACLPEKIGKGAFRGNLAGLGERVSDVITQTLLDADIAQALKINEWVDEMIAQINALAAKGVPKETLSAATLFLEKYKKVNIRLIRPDKPLLFDMKTFVSQNISDMIDLGRKAAKDAMDQAPLRSHKVEEFKAERSGQPTPAASNPGRPR